MAVESKITHSKSGSWRMANTRCQTPLLAQRSSRRQTLFQLPKYSGRSAPRGTGLGDPKDGINEQTIVLGGLPMLAGLAGQVVLDSLPVGIFNRVAGWHSRPSMV